MNRFSLFLPLYVLYKYLMSTHSSAFFGMNSIKTSRSAVRVNVCYFCVTIYARLRRRIHVHFFLIRTFFSLNQSRLRFGLIYAEKR